MSEISPTASGHVLGRRSKQNLEGVHPDLYAVVVRGLQLSLCDFTVTEGKRAEKRQRQLVKAEKSKTMNSRHLPKVPRHNPELGAVSHAVDLGAWVNGTVSWNWDYYFQIADAMKQAAAELDVALNWGGCWSLLSEYDTAKQAFDAYVVRKSAQGKKPYTDGPHFELNWDAFPIRNPI